MLIMIPNNKSDALYSAVKKATYINEPAVPSQVVCATTVKKAKGKKKNCNSKTVKSV